MKIIGIIMTHDNFFFFVGMQWFSFNGKYWDDNANQPK